MRKAIKITVLVAATVCMVAMFASSAYAYEGWNNPCSSCHATAPSALTVVATAGANDGTTATYTVSAAGASEWAVFAGYTKIKSGSGTTTFSVPAGGDYSVYAVAGTPSAGSYGTTHFEPAGTFPVYGVDYMSDSTAPVSTSNAAATYSGSALVRIDATDAESGVAYIYYSINGGPTRTTPIGTSGYALAWIRPTTAGTFDYTLTFWSQDREGNMEDPAQTASFQVVRTGTESVAQAGPLTTLGTNGMSQWSYQDLADSAAKYEGGYAAYGASSGYYANPHGGYDTATNKCKVCHAVHRAEGAYYLLRADSQDDACDYCHIGGSAHSSKVVYDANSAGKSTSNGHTIGASTYIPDSTESQWTQDVSLDTVDENGNPLSEIIQVRAYDEQKNDMYRFARHHGHSNADGGNRRNYVPVGPLALRCMSCHQVHNASYMTWQSVSMASLGTAGQYNATTTASYKLLKQSPSGTFVGGTDTYGQIPIKNVSLVPETTLTAGVNFDNSRAEDATPGALAMVRGSVVTTMARPMWVAQNFDGEHDRDEALAEEAIAASVNNAALSVWCADCHNLNIGGWEHLTNEELGFKAHTERTHPAPYTGAHSGPGQCYSCHRADLPRINTGDNCSQCHYGTGNYKENRTAGTEYVASDFPHSGEDADYKMLGSYSIVGGSATGNVTINDAVTVGPNNLDAVCLRCHGGIGTYH